MNVTFNGYITLTCDACNTPLTLESQALKFEQDLSVEAEDDDYIRYITQVDALCATCSAKLHVKVDVWEHPEAVANYSYYAEQGAHDIQCEFNIEHYFDDEGGQESSIHPDTSLTHKDESADDTDADEEREDEADTDADERKFNESSASDTYVDNYDSEDD